MFSWKVGGSLAEKHRRERKFRDKDIIFKGEKGGKEKESITFAPSLLDELGNRLPVKTFIKIISGRSTMHTIEKESEEKDGRKRMAILTFLEMFQHKKNCLHKKVQVGKIRLGSKD